MANPIWVPFWFFVFWFNSFFVAFFSAFCYIVFNVLEMFFYGLNDFNNILMQGIQFPRACAENMMDCKAPFSSEDN